MKQYIEFIMRDKAYNITLPKEKAQKVLESPQQLVMIFGDDGEWTGTTINKAEIVHSHRDHVIERDENDKELKKTALNAPNENTDAMMKMRSELVDKYKPDFLKRNE